MASISDVGALETTVLLNSITQHNPDNTVAAAWDLVKPSDKETAKAIRTQQRRSAETLGLEGDHSVPVTDSDTMPDGKYRSICKLFMSYQNTPDTEYTGTGWLIAPNVIATAGHSLYDREEKGGCLKSVKVHFGSRGPESVKETTSEPRWGISAALPASYMQASLSKPHYSPDTGFVVLDRPVTNIPPVRWLSTPEEESPRRLGVVGYPGDKDSGYRMYEDWRDVDVDLASSELMLSYKIDTMGGQSGSPVLNGNLEVVGVQNGRSSISPAGNNFSDYLLALSIKRGVTSVNGTVAKPSGVAPAPDFQFISIDPGRGSKGAVESAEDNEIIVQPVSKHSAKIADTVLSLPKSKVVVGPFTHYPERLWLDAPEDDETPGIPEKPLNEIMDRAITQADQTSVFRIHFPTTVMLSGEGRAAYRKVKEQVDSWNAWSTSVCERQVQRKIDRKELPHEDEGAFVRSSYRALVFDYLFRQSTWFRRSQEQNLSRHIQCEKLELHTKIIEAVLDGFVTPTRDFAELEGVFGTISDSVLQAKIRNDNTKQHTVIMLFKYTYNEYLDTVDLAIRTINFSISQELSEYSSNKSAYVGVNIDLMFTQAEANFDSDIYAQLQRQIDPQHTALGKDLLNMTTNADIEILV